MGETYLEESGLGGKVVVFVAASVVDGDIAANGEGAAAAEVIDIAVVASAIFDNAKSPRLRAERE